MNNYDPKLKEIIESSTFKTEDGLYVYAKVNSVESLDEHFMASKDSDEITVVTKIENLKNLDLIEKNKESYNIIGLNVSIPFYSVGFLATVTSAIANQGMNVLVVSTYSKDYILVKSEVLNKAKEVLIDLGFKEVD